MKRSYRLALVAMGAAVVAASATLAAETIVYSYDARGRLVKVERSGTGNTDVSTNYSYDKANNRALVTTTGSANPPSP